MPRSSAGRAAPDAAASVRDDGEAARALIERLGEQAACYATHEALKARRRGDRASSERWHWIAGAVREILRSEPDGRR